MESSNSIVDVDGLGSENDPGIEVTEPSPTPIHLTQAKGHGLTTLKIEHVDDLPEYPRSHIHGYTYAVSARGRSQSEMEQVVQEYARSKGHGPRGPVFSPFLNCRARKWNWKCSGIYACEFLTPALRSLHHTSVDDSFWQEILKAQREAQIIGKDLGTRNAYNYYRSRLNLFQKGHACIDKVSTCKPVFKQKDSQMIVYGEYKPYIGCINEASGVRAKHYREAIPAFTAVDLQFLEDLFNKDILPPTEDCRVFEPLTSRRKHCERLHPQGLGQLKRTTCDVTFNSLVPVDLSQCPYVLFTSHGVHKHPPPPPTLLPRLMTRESSRKRQRSSSASLPETQSALPRPPSAQTSARSVSRPASQNGDTECVSKYLTTALPRNLVVPRSARSAVRSTPQDGDHEYVSEYLSTTLPQPPPAQRSARLPSRLTSQNDDDEYVFSTYQSIRPIRPSHNLPGVAPTNALTFEQRRQELELRKLEADVRQKEAEVKQKEIGLRKQEEEIREMELENEKRALKVREMWIEMQDRLFGEDEWFAK